MNAARAAGGAIIQRDLAPGDMGRVIDRHGAPVTSEDWALDR